jgi:hypothetical protein
VDVIIFGAGASAPAGLPLGASLASELRAWLTPGRASSEFEIWKALEDDGTFRGSGDLELDLTRLDVRLIEEVRRRPLERGVSIEAGGAKDITTFRTLTLPDNLSSMLLTRQSEAFAANRVEYLRRFIRQHVHPGDTIVTFNYDTLVEAILQDEGRWGLRNGYGIDLSEAYPGVSGEPGSPSTVLKLHGSVGWMSEVAKSGLLLSQAALRAIGYPTLERKDFAVSRDVRYTSVLPSYIKGFNRYPLVALWRAAGEVIRMADRVAIVGYSMPSADSTALMLLAGNLQPRQPTMYYWHAESERDRAVNLRKFMTIPGGLVRERQSSIETLAAEPTLWP